jgi:hypothetical protein
VTKPKQGARARRTKGRDERGRWLPRTSGNPRGRPTKQPELPRLLGQQLADALVRKVPVTGPDGKTRKVAAYDRIIEKFMEEMPNSKPKEIMNMLAWMEKLGVFDQIRAAAEGSESVYERQYRQRQNSASLADIFSSL